MCSDQIFSLCARYLQQYVKIYSNGFRAELYWKSHATQLFQNDFLFADQEFAKFTWPNLPGLFTRFSRSDFSNTVPARESNLKNALKPQTTIFDVQASTAPRH